MSSVPRGESLEVTPDVPSRGRPPPGTARFMLGAGTAACLSLSRDSLIPCDA